MPKSNICYDSCGGIFIIVRGKRYCTRCEYQKLVDSGFQNWAHLKKFKGELK